MSRADLRVLVDHPVSFRVLILSRPLFAMMEASWCTLGITRCLERGSLTLLSLCWRSLSRGALLRVPEIALRDHSVSSVDLPMLEDAWWRKLLALALHFINRLGLEDQSDALNRS